jgi:hypothetical protein
MSHVGVTGFVEGHGAFLPLRSFDDTLNAFLESFLCNNIAFSREA